MFDVLVAVVLLVAFIFLVLCVTLPFAWIVLRALAFGMSEWKRAFKQALKIRRAALTLDPHDETPFHRQLIALFRLTWDEFGDVYNTKTIQHPSDPQRSARIIYNGKRPT